MERVLQQGPTNTNTNTTFFVEHQHFKVEESLVVENGGRGSASDCSYESFLLNTTEEEEKLRFLEEEEEEQQQRSVQSVQSLPFSLPSLEDKMPFLQMLQSVEAQSFSFTHQPYFQKLLSSIQDKHQWGERNLLNKEMELESCITHEICEASETKEDQHCNGESSNSAQEEKSCCKEENWVQFEYNNEAPPPLPTAQMNDNNYMNNKSEERRKKRKRTTRVSKKNKEEVETQRMTHITVERNRRKQMNDHLNVLRSLMPSSFVQRGDQASIIGGAIDFVKELEQHLQSLEAQKRMRSSSSSSSKSTQPQEEEEEEEEEEFMRRKSFMRNRFFISPQYTTYSSLQLGEEDDDEKEVINTQKSRMGMADIEVIVIQSHVNLKILTPRRQGQLLRAIAAFEDIRLTVLHLNVTSFDQSVLYSFNLKIEDGCEISTADDIAATVYQIFSFINSQQQQFDG